MRAMDEETVQRLLDRLIEVTIAGQLSWESLTDYAFAANASERSRFRLASIDSDDHHPYELHVLYKGDTVQTISSDFDRLQGILSSSEVNDKLAKLYEEVKKRTLGLDEAVNEIFEDLKYPDVPF